MPIVNFSIPHTLEKKVKTAIKERGFATKAEFFRFAALYALGAFDQREAFDARVRVARRDYASGNFKTARSAKTLLRGLKK